MKLLKITALLATALLLMSGAELIFADPSDDAVAQAIQPFVDDGSTPGAVFLIGNKDKILDLKAVGHADLTTGQPLATDDVFAIASMSKPICATAVMMLVEAGKISVDDPVEKYLPEFKGQMIVDPKDPTRTPHAPLHPVTIRNLLTHTSGLPYSTPEEKPTLDGHTLHDAAVIYGHTPLQFEPGTRFFYSSAGINTAARIVEVVSGEPYEQFLQERLFTPLGMVDTTFWPTEAQLQRHPGFYKINATKTGLEATPSTRFIYPLSDRLHRFPIPASGLFSTASDMYRFCRMIANDGTYDGKTYLTPDSIHEMTTRQTPATLKQSYGFGWIVGPNFIEHDGSYHTHMKICAQSNLILILLQQIEGPSFKDEAKISRAFDAAAISAFGQK